MKCKFQAIWKQYEDVMDAVIFWVACITALIGILFLGFQCVLICFAEYMGMIDAVFDFLREPWVDFILKLPGIVGCLNLATFGVKTVIEKYGFRRCVL